MKTKSLATPLKIIKILKIMTEKPVNMEEIMSALEDDNNFVNKETISKYFATLRNAGCDIQKRKNKFYIRYPILNFNDTELNTLSILQKTAYNLCSKKDSDEFLKFLDKLFTLVDKTEINYYKNILQTSENINIIDKELTSKFKDKIETISQFMGTTAQKIKITYEDKSYNIIPLKFHYFKKSICLFAYDCSNKVNKNFSLGNISDIKQTPSMAQNTDFSLTTTFKIKGRLKNSYLLKEGEILSEYGDYAVITNKNEDKEELFNRLLKYGRNCEILYPKSDREKFINLVETLILNIK